MRHFCGTALLVAGLLAPAEAMAQVAPHNAERFAEAFAKVEAAFGGRDAFQKAYEDARAEQARVEAALQLSLNLEARFRANNAIPSADIYLNAANALRTSVENLRETFTKFEALDSPLDEARGRAAYDRVTAEIAPVFQQPMTEQFQYAKTHPLTGEPLKSVQTAAGTLVAVAHKKPG
jgi:hypothetical protein